MIKELADLPDISFIDNMTLDDVQDKLVADYISKYEELTGKPASLSRADPVSLILHACGVEIFQAMLYVDRAGKQDLLKYSYGAYLDHLAAMKGMAREPAKPAAVTMRFTLSAAQASPVPILAGTRVATGSIYFSVDEYAEIPAGDTYIDVTATCDTAGIAGNGILAGAINTLVDPIPYVASVANTETSAGGTDTESDESLAGRIYMAPSSYSTAGPEAAYRYWVQTFNSSISDVYIASTEDAVVLVEFILEGGILPSAALCRQLEEYLMDEQIRPLTDRVVVRAPDTAAYNVNATYYINRSDSAKAATIQAAVSAAVSEYVLWQQSKIGRDINPSKLISMMEAAGAKRVVVTTPAFTVVPETSVPAVGTVAVNYGGLEDD